MERDVSGGRTLLVRLLSSTSFVDHPSAKLETLNVRRSAQFSPANPASHSQEPFSGGRPGIHFSVLGRLSRQARLGQDPGRQRDHRPASKVGQRPGPGAGSRKNEIGYDKSFVFHCSYIQFGYIRYYMQRLDVQGCAEVSVGVTTLAQGWASDPGPSRYRSWSVPGRESSVRPVPPA